MFRWNCVSKVSFWLKSYNFVILKKNNKYTDTEKYFKTIDRHLKLKFSAWFTILDLDKKKPTRCEFSGFEKSKKVL